MQTSVISLGHCAAKGPGPINWWACLLQERFFARAWDFQLEVTLCGKFTCSGLKTVSFMIRLSVGEENTPWCFLFQHRERFLDVHVVSCLGLGKSKTTTTYIFSTPIPSFLELKENPELLWREKTRSWEEDKLCQRIVISEEKIDFSFGFHNPTNHWRAVLLHFGRDQDQEFVSVFDNCRHGNSFCRRRQS